MKTKEEASVGHCVKELELTNGRWSLAREVLGPDFVSPAEIMHQSSFSCFGQQQRLGEILPPQVELTWCREQGMFLVPSPGDKTKISTLFSKKVWMKLRQFTPEVGLTPGWLALTKKPLPDSFSLGWGGQSQLLVEPMVAPNLLEILWAVWVYRTVRHERLLGGSYVRAAPTVIVGYAEPLLGQKSIVGLHVDTCWDQDRASNLGLLGARRFF